MDQAAVADARRSGTPESARSDIPLTLEHPTTRLLCLPCGLFLHIPEVQEFPVEMTYGRASYCRHSLIITYVQKFSIWNLKL